MTTHAGPVTLSSLSTDQREALENLQSITGLSVEKSVGILVKYRWNTERALHNVLDGNVDDVEDAEVVFDDDDGPGKNTGNQAGNESTNTGNGASSSSSGAGASGTGNAGSSSSADASSTSTRQAANSAPSGQSPNAPWVAMALKAIVVPKLKALLPTASLLPIGLSNYIRLPRPSPLFSSSRAAPPRRRTDDPRAAAARFLLDFEQKYGRTHPEFYQGTYNQALDAAKRDMRYFLAVLQSEEHDETEAFTRQVLCSDRVITFLRENNFVVWGGNIKESEAFQVSGILEATRYPFLALIAPSSSQMRIFDRLEGPTTAEAVVDRLTRRLAAIAPQLEGVRRERREREEARSLREMQDRAYRESLRADEEKARKAEQDRLEAERLEQERLLAEKEEQERLEREERERQNKQQSKAELKAAAKEKWETLPEPDGAGTTKLSVRLPSGARVMRRFRASDTMELLYDYLLSLDLDPIPLESDFVVVGTYPRREFKDKSATLQDCGLVPNGALLVEEAVPEDEE